MSLDREIRAVERNFELGTKNSCLPLLHKKNYSEKKVELQKNFCLKMLAPKSTGLWYFVSLAHLFNGLVRDEIAQTYQSRSIVAAIVDIVDSNMRYAPSSEFLCSEVVC